MQFLQQLLSNKKTGEGHSHQGNIMVGTPTPIQPWTTTLLLLDCLQHSFPPVVLEPLRVSLPSRLTAAGGTPSDNNLGIDLTELSDRSVSIYQKA